LKAGRTEFHGFLHSPKARGFHVILELKDVPGSLNSVLELLRKYVDLTNTVSYSTPGGKAISSIFARAISR
jgi:hypothetical protein